MTACLAAWADPLPAAWVRAAALDDLGRADGILAAMMEQVTGYLRTIGVTELAWLAAERWPNTFAPEVGFRKLYTIVTYTKEGLDYPTLSQRPDIDIRPAREGDYPALAELEALAFAPIWRHSANSLRLARRLSISFDVVEMEGRPVAFQYSVLSEAAQNAHLVRMTVHPDWQGRGIGGALLAHTLDGYSRQRLTGVSLNTQSNNERSQRLYERFGFRPTGEPFPIWHRAL
jgi:ribosomal-protein-alanine N-acetyltransferase